MGKSTIFFACVASLAVLASPVFAAAEDAPLHVSGDWAQSEVRTFKVHYGDLNLQSPEGVSRLTSRVKMAVKEVCAPMSDRDLSELYSVRSCTKSATSRAMSEVAYVVAQVNNGQQVAGLTSGELNVRSQ